MSMEHPLISIDPNTSVEDLQARITDLTKKLAFASRSGNGHLYNQIRLALNTYQSHYQARVQQIHNANQNQGTDYSDRINIT